MAYPALWAESVLSCSMLLLPFPFPLARAERRGTMRKDKVCSIFCASLHSRLDVAITSARILGPPLVCLCAAFAVVVFIDKGELYHLILSA